MQLRPNYTHTYQSSTLTVYENGKPIIRQPFDSDNGKNFGSEEEALNWALKYFPHLFTA
jgi:hypothetical protein